MDAAAAWLIEALTGLVAWLASSPFGLLLAVAAVLWFLPKLLWRDWTRNAVIFKGGGGGGRRSRRGPGVVFAALRWCVEAVLAAVGSLALAVAGALGRGAGGAWRWGINETAQRTTKRSPDPDGLEDLWRRS